MFPETCYAKEHPLAARRSTRYVCLSVYQMSTTWSSDVYQMSSQPDALLPDVHQTISDVCLPDVCQMSTRSYQMFVYQKSTRCLPDLFQLSARYLPDPIRCQPDVNQIISDVCLPDVYQIISDVYQMSGLPDHIRCLPDVYQKSTRCLLDVYQMLHLPFSTSACIIYCHLMTFLVTTGFGSQLAFYLICMALRISHISERGFHTLVKSTSVLQVRPQ